MAYTTSIFRIGEIQDENLEVHIEGGQRQEAVSLSGAHALFVNCLCDFGASGLRSETATRIYADYSKPSIGVDGLKRLLARAGYRRDAVFVTHYGKGWFLNPQVCVRTRRRRRGEGALRPYLAGNIIELLDKSHQIIAPQHEAPGRLPGKIAEAVGTLDLMLAQQWAKIRKAKQSGLGDDEIRRRSGLSVEDYEADTAKIRLTFFRFGIQDPWADRYDLERIS